MPPARSARVVLMPTVTFRKLRRAGQEHDASAAEALLKEVRHGHPRGCCTQAGRLQSKRISDRAQDVCFIVRVVEVGGITGHRSEERRVGKECRSRWWRCQ